MKINNIEYEIKPLPIKKYADLFAVLDSIPKQIEEIAKLDNDKVIGQMPKIIGKNINEFVKIVSIGTGAKIDEINEVSLLELIKIVHEIIKANQYAECWDEVKKVVPLVMIPQNKAKAE